jgi:hypothetical protein
VCISRTGVQLGKFAMVRFKVKVTLRLTVSQSVSPCVEPHLGSWPDIYYSLTFTVFFLCGAVSVERTGLSFVYAAGLRQRSLSRIRVPWARVNILLPQI